MTGMAVSLLGSNRRAIVDVGLDRSGTNGIDPDAMAAEFQRQLLRHGQLRSLGGRIGGGAGGGEGTCAVDRGNDDDGAALTPFEVRYGEAQREISAAQVDGDRLVPLLARDVLDRRPGTVDAGIGNHGVKTTEPCDEALHGRVHLVFVGNIGVQPLHLGP